MDIDREQLLAGCLKHMAEDASRARDADAEEAWFDLYDMAMSEPEEAWPILLELIARAPEESLSMIAAGPLGTFLGWHDSEFAERIKSELAANEKFRRTYDWTYHADLGHSFTRGGAH